VNLSVPLRAFPDLSRLSVAVQRYSGQKVYATNGTSSDKTSDTSTSELTDVLAALALVPFCSVSKNKSACFFRVPEDPVI
jgi:hypothetical protein